MDSFLNRVFSFTKAFSVIVLLLLVITMVGSIFYGLTAMRNKLDVPVYKIQKVEDVAIPDNVSVEELTHMDVYDPEKYEKRVTEIVHRNMLTEESIEIIMNHINNLDQEYRDAFINGFDQYLKDAVFKDKDSNRADAANEFVSKFHNSVSEYELNKIGNKTKQLTALAVFGVCTLLIVGCTIIPLLVRIESNTRKPTA